MCVCMCVKYKIAYIYIYIHIYRALMVGSHSGSSEKKTTISGYHMFYAHLSGFTASIRYGTSDPSTHPPSLSDGHLPRMSTQLM